jgi:hypothetical protein
MNKCPACREAHCVNMLKILISSRAFPQACKKCEKSFYVEEGVAGIFTEIAVFIFGFFVAAAQSTVLWMALTMLGFIFVAVTMRVFGYLVVERS